jgi:hypothetical protein
MVDGRNGMMSPHHRLIALSCALYLFSTAASSQDAPREAMPWDTCTWVEGKGGDCRAGNPPRPFKEFLDPVQLVKAHRDGFSAEFGWDLDQKGAPVKANWREIGLLGSHRIRTVRFSRGEYPLADLVLAEGSAGIFTPLLNWSGTMPDPVIYRVGPASVLVVQKDFGGNVPMVSTWAWVWGSIGPIKLDVERAVHDAIHKVAPGHTGYDTGLDWDALHSRTWTWPEGEYPGKVGVGETAEAWFDFDGTRLAVKRAVFRKDGGAEKRWP